jgi:Domain of unknown function DUF29
LIKQKIQPDRDGASWRASILNGQQEILDAIDSSPSLRRRLADWLEETYAQAIQDACYATGLDGEEIPAECPFTLDQLLEGNPTLLHFETTLGQPARPSTTTSQAIS